LELLRQLAVSSGIEDPCSIFQSQELFEKCIRAMVRGIKMSGNEEDQEIQDMLSKFYDFRKKLEDERSHVKGITNSRQISEGQFLKILTQENGVFTSQVVKNSSQALNISRPVNRKNITVMKWGGAKISVYFWRENDAGYVFDSSVEDEVFSKGISALRIPHCDSLIRTQRRKSTRLTLHKAVYLYLLQEDGEDLQKLETVPGLKCYLEDISDTGCAITVGGKTEAGLKVKIQFILNNRPVCMTGTVRSTGYNEDTKRSLLRIEADPLPQRTRNLILGEVFGTQDSGEDDMPFRELDEEAASAGARKANLQIQAAHEPSLALDPSDVSDESSEPNVLPASISENDDIFEGFASLPVNAASSDDFFG